MKKEEHNERERQEGKRKKIRLEVDLIRGRKREME